MRWRRRLKWVGLIAAFATALFGALLWMVYMPPNGTSINRVRSAEGVVALTFDDGPNPPYTRDLLVVLEKHHVRATFFMTGERVEAHPEVALEVAEAGHEIANHSYDASVLAFKPRAMIEQSIRRTDDELRLALGTRFKRSPFFRAPKGRQFLTVAGVLRRQGRIHIGASVLGNDWNSEYQEDSSLIVDAILGDLEAGDIIALHDGYDLRDGEYRGGTVRAVEEILTALESRGLRAVSVGDLLSSGDQGNLQEHAADR